MAREICNDAREFINYLIIPKSVKNLKIANIITPDIITPDIITPDIITPDIITPETLKIYACNKFHPKNKH